MALSNPATKKKPKKSGYCCGSSKSDVYDPSVPKIVAAGRKKGEGKDIKFHVYMNCSRPQ